jgi:hypothetical protein
VSQEQEFLEWLKDQDYWVNSSEVEEKFPDLEFEESAGITAKENEEGDTMIPKKDYRKLLIRKGDLN